MVYNAPVKLTSPRVWRTYQGGSQIDRIHGILDTEDSQFPEQWLMSVVNARNAGREHIPDEGLCYLAGQSLSLKDYIAADPESALGRAHVQRFGTTTGVLAKILDSAERLTIQVHPNRQRALELFGSPFGKTECWHILNCREIDGQEPCIYLGFRENITRELWMALFQKQDIPGMLECLHRFPVKPGETYLVNAGVPHAIGAGCLLVEIQEPTDYTVRTERVSPKGLPIHDYQIHQGLGFEKMFDCFTYQGCSFREAAAQWRIAPDILNDTASHTHTLLVGPQATACFSLERYDIRDTVRLHPQGRSFGLYIFRGTGIITTDEKEIPSQAGEQFFVPAGCTSFTLTAREPITAFCFFGPADHP